MSDKDSTRRKPENNDPAKPTLGTLHNEPPPAGRLGSLRGGSAMAGGQRKMKFTPTVPARRVKKEATPSLLEDAMAKSKTEESAGRGRGEGRGRGRGSGRGRGRGRGRGIEPEVVASGPFSMGPAASTTATRRAGGGSGGLASYIGGTGRQNEDEDGSATIGNEMDPWAPVSIKKDHDMPVNSEIKSEIMEVDVAEAEKAVPELAQDKLNEDKKSGLDNVTDEFVKGLVSYLNEQSAADDRLLFFQFPSVFPNFEHAPIDEISTKIKPDPDALELTSPDTSVSPQPGEGEVKVKKEPIEITIDDLTKKEKGLVAVKKEPGLSENQERSDKGEANEGLVGKLVVYASGKVKMKFGDIILDVTDGADCSFLQHIVALDANSKQAFVVGSVGKRFVCVPDIDMLLVSENEKELDQEMKEEL
ncbi:uncharacterized protein VTP21DRAFT_11560 [Calcarisporiella thermophila]|uniref:uncharacterized protein n=1 Tax=Calcarisporiella thermophila TaxID=911321 RepID=UPI003741F98C